MLTVSRHEAYTSSVSTPTFIAEVGAVLFAAPEPVTAVQKTLQSSSPRVGSCISFFAAILRSRWPTVPHYALRHTVLPIGKCMRPDSAAQ